MTHPIDHWCRFCSHTLAECECPDPIVAGIIAPDIYQGSVGAPFANRGGDAGELTPDTRGGLLHGPVSPGNTVPEAPSSARVAPEAPEALPSPHASGASNRETEGNSVFHKEASI